MRLHIKLMLGISLLIIIIGSIFELSFLRMMENTLKQEKGEQALSVAQSISHIPEIKEAFLTEQPSHIIQPIAERIRKQVRAEFIVIGNREEMRYSHPDPDKLGEQMVGGDNVEVFKGRSIISESVGSLGPSLRGKAPIYLNDEVIGVVSVGYLQADIKREIAHVRQQMLLVTFCILIGGIFVAFFISRNIRKATFGLEPKEIAWMYQEKHAILESIHEAIIAIDVYGKITVVNETAHKILQDDHLLRGQNVDELLENRFLLDVVQTGKAEYDQEYSIHCEVYLVNTIPILSKKGMVIGAVASLRNKSELSDIIQELSHVKAYAEGLRAQTHEYSNKLYTLLGLIQLGSYKEAVDYISKEVDGTQNLISFLMKEIPDPLLAGFILGKKSLASEMKIDFSIEETSSFKDIPLEIDREKLITIIGNLINNAFDAVRVSEKAHKIVTLFLTDLGKELIIEVEDNGVGIEVNNSVSIFEKGFTTKNTNENAGIGLNLVQKTVSEMGGYITFTAEKGKNTVFIVAIPKQRGRS